MLTLGGTFGEQSANEYCFTLSNAVVKASSDISKYAYHS